MGSWVDGTPKDPDYVHRMASEDDADSVLMFIVCVYIYIY